MIQRAFFIFACIGRMKTSALRLCSLLSMGLLSEMAATNTAPTMNSLSCIDPNEVDYSVDYFPEKAVVDHSKLWTISYHKTYKIITNTQANASYLLYQCGTAPPTAEDGKHKFNIKVPLQDGIALTSTTQIPHVELLARRRNITAWIGSKDFISSPCLNSLIDGGIVEHIDPGYNKTLENQMIDDWLTEHPDAVIIGGVWDSIDSPRRLIVSESREKSGNKAVFEWHKVYGALFNLEGMADDQSDEIEERYDCVSNNANLVTDDNGGKKPTVLWARYGSEPSGGNAWDVARCPNYYCEYASECSATLLDNNEGSIPGWNADEFMMDNETFFEWGRDAEHWIFPSNDWNTIYALFKDELDKFKAVKNKQVFDYQGSGENSWFEQRKAEYDVVLEDFCSVVGLTTPGQPLHKRKWFRNVDNEPVGNSGSCDPNEIDEPLQSQATECIRLTEDDFSASTKVTVSSWLLFASAIVVNMTFFTNSY